ncbi:MAG: PKD domain-containing protein, partial [Candidatus Pacearchaeota archaeon]
MELKKSLILPLLLITFTFGVLGMVSAATSVTLTFPNGGEYVSDGVTITWTVVGSQSTDRFDVRYSSDGGASWTIIAETLFHTTRSQFWDTTTAPDGSNFLIQVFESGSSPGAPDADSSSTFTVDNTAPTSSSGPLSNYQNSLTFNVPFTVTDANPDFVELWYRKDGGTWTKYGITFTSSPISFTSIGDGLYEFYTIATDKAGNVEGAPIIADTTTTVDTTAPTANAGTDQTVNENTDVIFDGSGSTDTGGSGIASYKWDIDNNDGVDFNSPDLTGQNPTLTGGYETPGSYTVTLQTIDNAGNSATDTLIVTVSDTTPPTVSVTGAGTTWIVSPTGGTADSICSDNVDCNLATKAYKFYSNSQSSPPTCSSTYTDYTPGNTFSVTQPGWVCAAIKDDTGNTGFSSPIYFKVSTTIQG